MAGGSKRKANKIAGSPPPPTDDVAYRRKGRKESESGKKSAALDTTASPGIDRADKRPK